MDQHDVERIQIVSCVAVKDIVTCFVVDKISASSTKHGVISIAKINEIIAASAADGVISLTVR